MKSLVYLLYSFFYTNILLFSYFLFILPRIIPLNRTQPHSRIASRFSSLQDVAGLGKLGDKIHVKHGFGRNHLIPKGLALYATPENRELMFVRHNIDVEALATADADADAASKQEALSGPKHPFFDAGANVIQRLNWRFRRQAVNAKSESLAVVNPVTKADILAVIRDAKFHHVSAADIVMHPEAEALDHYGAYQFMVRYQAPDYVGWVPVTAGVFPLLDTAMEVNKSLVKKELEEHQVRLSYILTSKI